MDAQKCLIQGQDISISTLSLYDMEANLSSGTIVPDFDKDGNPEYFDLYNADGALACMDGEVCKIEKIENGVITFANDNGGDPGDPPVLFTLTQSEAMIACFD